MERDFQNVSTPVSPIPRAFALFDGDDRMLCGARSLETFRDLGLSDGQIARYFRISETRVISLRRYFGLDR